MIIDPRRPCCTKTDRQNCLFSAEELVRTVRAHHDYHEICAYRCDTVLSTEGALTKPELEFFFVTINQFETLKLKERHKNERIFSRH